MFKVLIGASFSESSVVFSSPSVEPALSFALELHRVSNVDHVVYVLDKDDCQVVELVLNKPVE